MQTSIFAVVVSYNPELIGLSKLILSLKPQVSSIVIVDNHSLNRSEIIKTFGDVTELRIISLSENYGIAKAHNVGIHFAKSNGASHVIIFDQDSNPPSNLVPCLLAAEDELIGLGKKVAAVGPCYFDPRTARSYPFVRLSGFSLKRVVPPKGSSFVPVSFLISSGSLINMSVFDTVGVMREEFFIDYVDVEWGLRALWHGYESFGITTVAMEHSVGDKRLKFFNREICIHSPLRRYYLARNGVFMFKLSHVPWNYKVREFFYSLTRVVVFLLFVPNRLAYIKFILSGWLDGLRGRAGKHVARI